jgi:hypothetical protein
MTLEFDGSMFWRQPKVERCRSRIRRARVRLGTAEDSPTRSNSLRRRTKLLSAHDGLHFSESVLLDRCRIKTSENYATYTWPVSANEVPNYEPHIALSLYGVVALEVLPSSARSRIVSHNQRQPLTLLDLVFLALPWRLGRVSFVSSVPHIDCTA